MAETTKIAWTRSVFNSWIGCTKVGPGCDNCYAEVQDSRKRWEGKVHWGVGVPRYRTSVSNWKQVERWNKLAEIEQRTGVLTSKSDWTGRIGFWPVFCASLADVFDNEVEELWRCHLFQLIERTPNLSWLLVTKRIGLANNLAPAKWLRLGFPENVRIMITVVNQAEADRDIPKLLVLNCKNGISYEPAIGPVDWEPFLQYEPLHENYKMTFDMTEWRGVEWIIIGGESTQGSHKARPFNIEWARDTVAKGNAAGVPVFVKQLGSSAYGLLELPTKDRAGADPSEWPEDLRVREFPE